MTGMEVSTCAKYNLHPIVCILNNDGYGTQRHIIDGPFNNIHPWKYTKICELLNYGKAVKVKTKGALEATLKEAFANTKDMYLIEVVVPRDNCSEPLRRMAEHMSSQRDVNKRKNELELTGFQSCARSLAFSISSSVMESARSLRI